MRAELPADFSSRVNGMRTRRGLSQSRLAQLLDVSVPTVSRWESGQARPSAAAWRRIEEAERFGIDALGGVAAAGKRRARKAAAYRAGPPLSPAERGNDGVQPLPPTRDNLGDRGRVRTGDAPAGSSAREAAGAYHVDPQAGTEIDFAAEPEIVRAVAEGERLAYGYLFNSAFGTETSLIDPLPHQRIAVYEQMLTQPRLRFLLADDAGAGKTIMSGLYIREMLSRRLIRRVLIVPPAGLVGNWQRELRTLFGLHFRVISGSDGRLGNPFTGPESDLLIISVDTLAAERAFGRLQEDGVEAYDLVIFDEAHKLSADREPDLRVRRTDRYRLAEALAGIQSDDERWQLSWSAQHLILLTATPHMGKDFPYYALWRLLEPEVLSTLDAFHAYPAGARSRHFIRRTKEEMVRFDGSPIYPTRVSNTLSYDLKQGEVSEQRLYDETTRYIHTYYNRARILNRSAARLAMSIFQRRLASSVYALSRSFERRLAKLERLIDDIRSGRIGPERLAALQQQLQDLPDVFETATADEEETGDGREGNEAAEEEALGGVTATSLRELEQERGQVQALLDLARQLLANEQEEDSKLEKLLEVLRDPRYRDEKFIIFTEHRDTLFFLVSRLEALGFTERIAQIHGGMSYQERDEQEAFFRKPLAEGGANYLVATDAAGEGRNLQFCWLMVNYDIPWNPARLEQRMGRIHRYNQRHDPVLIINLVAGKTREGRVLKTLLEKLERIRRELGSDKVFDVVGRVFEGVSLREYMERATDEEGAEETLRLVEGRLTTDQVAALAEQERRLYGDGGDVRSRLPALRESIQHEAFRRLLPGYVRRFVEKAAPLIGIGIEGDLDGMFSFQARRAGALDPLWPVLEAYPPRQREHLTVYRPESPGDCVWMHPGEPLFDRFRAYVCSCFAHDALRGGVFVDPEAMRPYLFHLALVSVRRRGDADFAALAREELLKHWLVAMKQEESGPIEDCAIEQLLLLRGADGLPPSALGTVAIAKGSHELARAHALEAVARPVAEQRRRELLESLAEREQFLRRGYAYQEAELAEARAKLRTRAGATERELQDVRRRQREIGERQEAAIAMLRREPDLIEPGEVTFLAHALVVPSHDPEHARQRNAEIEVIAVRVAWAYEEARGRQVTDVSTPERARAAGLTEHPGFDLLSTAADKGERAIEVKGRARSGEIELTENEWARACIMRENYWLYVVFDCASAYSRLLRVQDPFGRLVMRSRASVIIDGQEILAAAEGE